MTYTIILSALAVQTGKEKPLELKTHSPPFTTFKSTISKSSEHMIPCYCCCLLCIEPTPAMELGWAWGFASLDKYSLN